MTARHNRCFRGLVLGTALAFVVACTGNSSGGSQSILWNKASRPAIGPVTGNIRVLVFSTPAPVIKFEGISGGFADGVARGAHTGARHGSLLGSFGVTVGCVNAGCALLLLVTAALALGGAAIGAIIGAIDGGVNALVYDDSKETVGAREVAMEKALAALPLLKKMSIGASQQLYETTARRLFFDDQMFEGKRRPYVERRPEYQIRITEISAQRVGREGAVRLRVLAWGRLLLAKSKPAPEPITAEFITDAYPLSTWFADDAKLFRQALLLGARLTSARLVAKLQAALRQ